MVVFIDVIGNLFTRWLKKSLPGTWSSIVNVFLTHGNIDIDVSDIFEFQVGEREENFVLAR